MKSTDDLSHYKTVCLWGTSGLSDISYCEQSIKLNWVPSQSNFSKSLFFYLLAKKRSKLSMNMHWISTYKMIQKPQRQELIFSFFSMRLFRHRYLLISKLATISRMNCFLAGTGASICCSFTCLSTVASGNWFTRF